MKMSTKLIKQNAQGLDTLKQDYTEEQNKEAFVDIRTNPLYSPLNGMVAERFAAQAKQIMDYGFTTLTHLRRGQAHKIIEILVRGSSWEQSIAAICDKLDLTRSQLYDVEKHWPYMYHFVNLMILEVIIPVSFGRVLHATADAAIHGSDRDRRLYYEMFAGLKAKGDAPGAQTIIFVNDSMARPQVVIPVEATESDD